MTKKILSGKEVSLADFSESGVIDYKVELQSVPGFNWIKRDFDLTDNKHEVVVARDVICHSIFNVFSVAEGVHLKNLSYPAVLNTFKVEHSRSGDALSVAVPGYIKKIAGPVFIIGGHNNHYHWLLNWFPRVMHLKRFELISRFPDLKFLVCSGLPSVYYDMFDSVGIPREKLIMHGMRDAVHIECAVFSNFFPVIIIIGMCLNFIVREHFVRAPSIAIEHVVQYLLIDKI
ncbi:glycosyltransferase family 61 protein [Ideonella paludis]|uniref:hypothetical protein n=1 Tax=Ideonella paludis TaxID=1233411 RepID=UPI00362D5F77